MTGIPRSQRLIFANLPTGGASGEWFCPAGYVTLVKSMTVYNTSGGSQNYNLWVQPAPSFPNVAMLHGSVADGTTVTQECWFVLHPEDQMFGYATGGPFFFYVSGAVLSGPPQFPSS